MDSAIYRLNNWGLVCSPEICFLCSCSPFFFFTVAHLHWSQEFLIILLQFLCFSSNEILFVLSNSLALSLLSTSVKTLKCNRNSICCCFFSLKNRDGHAISRPLPAPPPPPPPPKKKPVLHLGCHNCRLNCFTFIWYACGADGHA